MDPKARALPYDIQQAGVLVDRFTRGKIRELREGSLLGSGVERQLEIIGEALNQLANLDPDEVTRITNYRRIIALRNILVHGYARVDHGVIWNILEQSLPVLCREVDALMGRP